MTTKEWRYIKAYATSRELIPQLSAVVSGQIIFRDKSGQEVKVSMLAMKHEYEEMQATAKLAKKRKVA